MTNKELIKRFTKRRLEIDLLIDDKIVHSLKGTVYSSNVVMVREEIDEKGNKIEVCSRESLPNLYKRAEKIGKEKYGGKHSIRINTYPYQE